MEGVCVCGSMCGCGSSPGQILSCSCGENSGFLHGCKIKSGSGLGTRLGMLVVEGGCGYVSVCVWWGEGGETSSFPFSPLSFSLLLSSLSVLPLLPSSPPFLSLFSLLLLPFSPSPPFLSSVHLLPSSPPFLSLSSLLSPSLSLLSSSML